MLRILLLALALAAGASSAAQAQTARVLSSRCGSPPASIPANDASGLFMDSVGRLCVSASAVAPSTSASEAIQPVVAYGASALNAKATAGNLYGFSLTQGGTAGMFAFIDAAAPPALGAAITPIECVAVPASGYVARRQDIADRYVNGIQVVSSTSCTTYTANTPVQMSASVQ